MIFCFAISNFTDFGLFPVDDTATLWTLWHQSFITLLLSLLFKIYKAMFKLLHPFQVCMTFSVGNTSTLWVGNVAVAERWPQWKNLRSAMFFFLCIYLSQTIFVSFSKNLHIRKRPSYPCQCLHFLWWLKTTWVWSSQ